MCHPKMLNSVAQTCFSSKPTDSQRLIDMALLIATDCMTFELSVKAEAV